MNELMIPEFYMQLKDILTVARGQAYVTANFAMVEAYWKIGKVLRTTRAARIAPSTVSG